MTLGPRKRLYLGSALILVIGLCAAAAVYLTAGDVAYPVAPEDSKAYQRELERFGGKANVLAVELTRWFAGLWRGKALAYTLAAVSVAVSLALYVWARILEPE